ncbi:MAG: exo-beta-N-acetylmuramidase NamZ family protein [Thermodesulfobacteriota bacterium]
MTPRILTGLEHFIKKGSGFLKGKKIGLLANPASVNNRLEHAINVVHTLYPDDLKAAFSPQHGFFAQKQDNMIETDHFTDPDLNIPVFSLYSRNRKPTREMFDLIDILLVDLQDAGCRVYTFIYTISYCMELAARTGKEVMILDRPNPVGGIQVEGNLLEEEFASFVGRFPVPMRHGFTAGEISLFFNDRFAIDCDLSILPMKGWKRKMYYKDTGLEWILPSPNLPTPESCIVYPGQVVFEGTCLSEGRGTTRPFEFIGAPWLDSARLKQRVESRMEGIILRPAAFEPTFGKWSGETCNGVQIHVVDRWKYKPCKTALLILQEIVRLHPEHFTLKQPPYEYEYEKMPLDLILGSRNIRKKIFGMQDIDDIEQNWQGELDTFIQNAKEYHLYD